MRTVSSDERTLTIRSFIYRRPRRGPKILHWRLWA